MSNIRIDVGVYTALDVDLSAFDFTGVKNDFAANVTIDNTSDDDDTATLCGALAFGELIGGRLISPN